MEGAKTSGESVEERVGIAMMTIIIRAPCNYSGVHKMSSSSRNAQITTAVKAQLMDP